MNTKTINDITNITKYMCKGMTKTFDAESGLYDEVLSEACVTYLEEPCEPGELFNLVKRATWRVIGREKRQSCKYATTFDDTRSSGTSGCSHTNFDAVMDFVPSKMLLGNPILGAAYLEWIEGITDDRSVKILSDKSCGFTFNEIAERYGVTERTAKRTVKGFYNKVHL